jgi:hypothetical protein
MMDDAISRQAAISVLDETKRIASHNIDGAVLVTFEEVLESLVNITNALPTIQPEPKRGRWIYKTDLITAPTGYWECSECKEGRLLYEENFCPHCGADMREVTE